MKTLTRFKLFIKSFGFFQVPLIGHLGPKLISLSDDEVVVRLKLRRRSKNHLNSMYFGALAVGADLAGGLHSFYFLKRKKLKASIAFKSFNAQFLKRPESDVFFVCTQGQQIAEMLEESQRSKNRVNQPILVKAYTNYPQQPEEVAHFNLELSVKVV